MPCLVVPQLKFLRLTILLCFLTTLTVAQTVSLTPPSLSFGNQLIDSVSKAQNVVLKNTSTTKTLTITSLVASGQYSTTSCPSTLMPQASCTMSVTFAPNTTGTINGAITIADNSSPSPQIVPLSGTGIGPIAFTPQTVNFGTVAVGSHSAAKTVTVTNKTTSNVNLSAAPGVSGDYSVSSTSCSTGNPLPPNGSCTVSITFSPTVTGSISGALTISDSASGSPQGLALSGTGSGSTKNVLSFSPASLSFGNELLDGTAPAKKVTLKNIGTASFNVTGVGASGNYAATTTCGTVNPGGSCTITVTFTPTNTGTVSGAVTVTTNESESPHVFSVTGAGVGDLSFAPSGLNFGIQDNNVSGGIASTQNATLSNNTSAAIAISTAVSGNYTQTNTCGGTVAAHSSCSFQVTFTPNKTGGLNGALTLTDSGMNSPQVLSLTATSTNPPRFAHQLGTNGSAIMSQFVVDPVSGRLRPLDQQPLSLNCAAGSQFASAPGATYIFVPAGTCGIGAYNLTVAGSFTAVTGSPFVLGSPNSQPQYVVVTPSGKYMYAIDAANSNLIAASVDAATGALTEVTGSPYALGVQPQWMAVDPASKFLYVVNNNNGTTNAQISAFSINATTGQLTAISGSPFLSGVRASGISVTPSGKYLLVANAVNQSLAEPGNVSVFSIGTGGGLTQVVGSPFAVEGQNQPTNITVDPGGVYAYVSEAGDAVSVMSLNPTSGNLTSVKGSPFTVSGNPANRPSGVTTDPTGRFLYVPEDSGPTTAMSVNLSNGNLTVASTTGVSFSSGPINVSSGTSPLQLSPTWAYASNSTANSISEYSINVSNGALSPISGSPLTDNAGPQLVKLGPSGHHRSVFTAESAPSIAKYDFGTTSGGLNNRLSLSVAHPIVALAPDPSFLYVYGADPFDQVINSYSVDQTLGLGFLGSSAVTSTSLTGLAISPQGTYLYAVSSGDNTLWAFRVAGGAFTTVGNPNKGGLPGFPTGANPLAVVVDATGKFAYVANSGDGTVSGYAINPNGDVSAISGSPFFSGTTPTAIASEPTGSFLYVTNSGSGNVSAFAINPTSGALSTVPGSPFNAGNNPVALGVSLDGRFVYVANKGSNTITSFTINKDGSLGGANTAATGSLPTAVVSAGTIQ